MAIEEFIARKISPDGSTGTSKATIENHVVTYENSETPSPYITEIKTLNGVSLVGSGNYDFDTTLNEASTNAVQNKVITEYIYDLESKVSTLAVKVYNHDIALGTLNIENVLYSVENADSFAIPTTIGTNADVVIPKSRMALNTIKGKTEYSRNLIGFDDISETILNGIAYSVSNGVISIKGTATANANLFITLKSPIPIGTYTFKNMGNDWTLMTNQFYLAVTSGNYNNRAQLGKGSDNSVTTEREYGAFLIQLQSGETFTGVVKPMLVQGTTAPTAFVPYYTGLKNVELNSLNVYGESDEYTSLNANDKVSAIRYFYPTTTLSFVSNMTLVDKDGNVAYVIQVWVNHETLGSFTKIWRGNYATLLINANTAGMNGVFKLDGVYKVYNSENRISYGALNATSVKSILPTSILPKTLASYERLEVIDNGDDTYKIDLVSHAELHVGDEINSLWVGNPQSENYGNSEWNWFLDIISDDVADLRFAVASMSSSNSVYNRLIVGSSYSSFTDYSFSYVNGSNPCLGGSDKYVSGVSTDRNIIIPFKYTCTIKILNNIASIKNDFRNGEETRTTLIDGLSLDDVSAVIDTNDIVYADNSNAEYDVSIAETSVELLVNKTN